MPFLLQLDDSIPCSSTCGDSDTAQKGDMRCHDEYNNCGCDWDGGDCCRRNADTQYCSACECLSDKRDFLSIHNGGSNDSEIVAKLIGQMNDTKISVSGNQMFIVFHTNEETVRKGFHALIMESKYLPILIIILKSH